MQFQDDTRCGDQLLRLLNDEDIIREFRLRASISLLGWMRIRKRGELEIEQHDRRRESGLLQTSQRAPNLQLRTDCTWTSFLLMYSLITAVPSPALDSRIRAFHNASYHAVIFTETEFLRA